MKELSIEEKAKRYDEAIERAKAINNGKDVDVEASTTTCEYIFPELKESEFLNTESMIESYKQRLISQANGVKSSPLIDMCLASYKHGINETLDTLNLSNVEKTVKIWKDAQGDDLPEYDREVIAILDYDFWHYKVVYAHRPNPDGWNGTNIDTGEKEHFEPEIYDKGGWNQPHILYWLDTRLPYEENKIIK